MKAAYYFPNIFLTALAAVFVLIGSGVYVWSRYTPETTPVSLNLPDKIATPSAVLSEQTREPDLYLPPGPQPQIGAPLPISADLLALQSTIDGLREALGDSAKLSSFLSSDLAEIFTSQDLQTALEVALRTNGPISGLRSLGEPNISGSFADQNVEITTAKGAYRYQVFLKLENGSWKLMGTEPLP